MSKIQSVLENAQKAGATATVLDDMGKLCSVLPLLLNPAIRFPLLKEEGVIARGGTTDSFTISQFGLISQRGRKPGDSDAVVAMLGDTLLDYGNDEYDILPTGGPKLV